MAPTWTLAFLKKVSSKDITTQHGKTTWLRQSKRAMVGDYLERMAHDVSLGNCSLKGKLAHHKVNKDLKWDTLASGVVGVADRHARSSSQKVRPAGSRPNNRSSIVSTHDDRPATLAEG